MKRKLAFCVICVFLLAIPRYDSNVTPRNASHSLGMSAGGANGRALSVDHRALATESFFPLLATD